MDRAFFCGSAGAVGEMASDSPGPMSVIARFLIALVRAYQVTISPWLGRACRFEPSCSRYTIACLNEHGAMRGGLLSVKRLCKCHPFHPGGFDPPPSTRISKHASEDVRAA